jgi:hypothetical protein
MYPVTATLSVEASHATSIVELVCPVTMRFAGAVGGVVSPATASVVPFAVFESTLVLFATSRARTVYAYVVAGVSAVSRYVVEPTGTVAMSVPSRRTLYSFTPLPISVDASHEMLTVVDVCAVTTRFCGTVGGVVSAAATPNGVFPSFPLYLPCGRGMTRG